MNTPKVFSYQRFSHARQATGASLARQADLAAQWAAKHKLELDTSLTMRDEGLSAYKGTHVKKGALGVFLKAVEDGRVPQGSVLVVEHLDRLSRAEVDIALAQLLNIIHGGIRIVTAVDEREYSIASVRKNPTDLIISITLMMKAHSESSDKAGRVTDAIVRACEGWILGKRTGKKVGPGTDPSWVRHNAKAGCFELDADAARAVRRVIELWREGYGAMKALEIATAEGGRVPKGLSNESRVNQLLAKETLIGTRTITVRGKAYALEGYYPPLIDHATYDEIQHLRTQRGRRQAKGDIVGIVTGFGVTVCGHCGAAMTAQNMRPSVGASGTIYKAQRRLLCSGSKRLPKCPHTSCNIVPIEAAILRFCSNQMDLSSLFASGDSDEPVAQALAAAHKRLAATERQLAKIAKALEADEDDNAPQTFLQATRKLEKQMREQQEQVERLKRELSVRQHATPASADTWAKLAAAALALDPAARMKVRKLIGETFAKVTVFMRGYEHGDNGEVIRLHLLSKKGISRELAIDRKTGDLLEVRDVDLAEVSRLLRALKDKADAEAQAKATKPATRARKTTAKKAA
ncbi:recombinase family protein [Paraburkholderia sp. EG287B]|uniref:recombinase family protein n=1 Tax=Paraburkholderia sp. EG287B TaxID=3237010 RepID=UPI0034D30B16